jgi:hypothetical protein
LIKYLNKQSFKKSPIILFEVNVHFYQLKKYIKQEQNKKRQTKVNLLVIIISANVHPCKQIKALECCIVYLLGYSSNFLNVDYHLR